MLGDFIISHPRVDLDLQFRAAVAPFFARVFEPSWVDFTNQVAIAGAAPWPLQVDLADGFAIGIPVFDLLRAANFFGEMTNQFFDQDRHFFEIGIGPVRFQHGKFRVVLSGNTLVPKISVDLENLVEPADQQTF